MTTLLIATRNRHKAGEIRAILGEGVRYLTLNDFPDAPEVVEDAGTFAGNATKKAAELARWLEGEQTKGRKAEGGEFFVLADDSGLEVDALGRAPGIHTARFASLDRAGQGNSPDADNNAKLLRLLKDVPVPKRTARFRCVLALAQVEGRGSREEGRNLQLRYGASTRRKSASAIGNPQLFEGVCEGQIGFEPRGTNGFGYDPLFIPNGFHKTFAELGGEIKNRMSHRARALIKLRDWLASGSAAPPGPQ